MKTPTTSTNLKVRFDRASAAIEARFGDKPAWVKMLVFAPVLIVLTAVVTVFANGVGKGLMAIMQGLHHA